MGLIDDILNDAPKDSSSIHDLVASSIIPQGVEIPEPESVFSLGDATLCTRKSISTLVGKAKVGKTTVTSWMVARMLNMNLSVLWFDTEQGEYYGSRTQYWALTVAGMAQCDRLTFFDLKIHRPETRSEIVEAAIGEFKPDIVIIDGARDLLYDINSTDQSLILCNDLMKWAVVHDCHIMSILHLNKGDGNARGHIGTELTNKSETVIKVDLGEDNMILCSPERTRSKPFNPFAFDRDDKGIPVLIEGYSFEEVSSTKRESSLNPNDPNLYTSHREVVHKMFSKSKYLKYSECIAQVRLYFEIHGVKFGENKARSFMEYYRNEGLIVHDETVKGYAKWRSGLTQTNDLPDEAPF